MWTPLQSPGGEGVALLILVTLFLMIAAVVGRVVYLLRQQRDDSGDGRTEELEQKVEELEEELEQSR